MEEGTGLRLALLAVTASAIALAPQRAHACTCMSAETPGDAFTRASVVFAGTVGAVTHIADDRYETTFAVGEVFRGNPGKTAVVASRWNGGTCDYSRFTAGAQLLVYAGGTGATLYVSACSGTRPLDQAATDLAYLRHALKARIALVEGAVHLWGDPRQSSEKVPRAGVEIRARGTPHATRTGADGSYRLELPPGTYTLDAIDEPGLSTGGVPVELPAPGTWARRDFSEAWNGRIRGHLVDHTGGPAAGVLVRALPAGSHDPTSADGRVYSSAITDAAGNYEIAPLSEGAYRVAVSVPFHPDLPLPATYFPGVPHRAKAVPVQVARGGLVTGIDFALPPPLRLFTVTCRVKQAGPSTSYLNARVELINNTARRTSHDVAMGDDARVAFREVAGDAVKIYACEGALGDGLCTDPVAFTLDQDRTITLTLPRRQRP